MQIGGIVLAGGAVGAWVWQRRRCALDRKRFWWRMVRLVSEAASTVVAVAAQDQELPPLPSDVLIARDALPGRGPLEGIAAGLRMLPAVDVVYITACDTPLLRPAVLRRLIESARRQIRCCGPVCQRSGPAIDCRLSTQAF